MIAVQSCKINWKECISVTFCFYQCPHHWLFIPLSCIAKHWVMRFLSLRIINFCKHTKFTHFLYTAHTKTFGTYDHCRVTLQIFFSSTCYEVQQLPQECKHFDPLFYQYFDMKASNSHPIWASENMVYIQIYTIGIVSS